MKKSTSVRKDRSRSFAAALFLFGAGLSGTAFPQESPATSEGPGQAIDNIRLAAPSSVPGTAAASPLPPEKSAIEASVGYGGFSNGYGDAQSYSLRGMQVMSFGVLEAEAVNQSRFGYTGNYGGLNLTKDLSPDYYTIIGAGAGSSLLFPSWRTDATLYRKFGDQRQYVAGLGAYYAKGNAAERSDAGIILSGIYYARDAVIEGGLRLNQANPGAVLGPSQYVAVTFGNDDRRAIILRLEHAKETYQVLTTGVEKVDYLSNTASVQWRERITRDGMLIAGLTYYKNPIYNRTSLDLGWRWSFR
jgi:YaiO family outer membrane protein